MQLFPAASSVGVSSSGTGHSAADCELLLALRELVSVSGVHPYLHVNLALAPIRDDDDPPNEATASQTLAEGFCSLPALSSSNSHQRSGSLDLALVTNRSTSVPGFEVPTPTERKKVIPAEEGGGDATRRATNR